MSKSHYSEHQRNELVLKLMTNFGNQATKENIIDYCEKNGLPNPHFLISRRDIKDGKFYNLQSFNTESVEMSTEEMSPALQAQVIPLKPKRVAVDIDNIVPEKDNTYVPFGFFKQLEQIIKHKSFYPVFITGLSGNGKTTMVEQVAAKLKRECIRVNISVETDEEDLIGGNTLQDGNVIYREGPVLSAMRRGAILLLDEIDRGSNKLMCLQSVLEGKAYFNKKTGEVIRPAAGFNVIATANTKGRGTEDGRFITAQILDEAFLERFPITVEQEYPSTTVEKKIVANKMEFYGKVDTEFAEKLIAWADIIRKTFKEGGVDEIISTRRLVNIVQAYSIFDNRVEAIGYCINRFDDDTKNAFMDLYTKMNAPAEPEQVVSPVSPLIEDDEIPF
jgi:cobaltochelatase CobS